MKFILILPFLVWLLTSFDFKKQAEAKIIWKSSQRLSWRNYKAFPDTMSSYKAMTFVQVGLEVKEFRDSLVIAIPCYFFENLSWSKNQHSTLLLKHEQLHFDIAELISRKIRKEFSEYKYYDLKLAYKDLQKIYDRNYKIKLDSINSKYDLETDHGVIVQRQNEWERKIANELRRLDRYTSTKVILKRQKSQ